MEAAVVKEEEHHELAPQLHFPPGYHFVPTELELLSYLRRKIERQEQPLAVVNEVAILDSQPGSLVEAYKGYGENKWYFFTVRELSSSKKEEEPNRKVRVPGVKATWKATGSVVPIAAARAKQQDEGGKPAEEEEEKVIVGTKRVLIYQSSDAEEDGKWSMHEYILKGHAKIGEYALCSIQRKQHSDTVDHAAGEGTSSRKRTKATNRDLGKAKKRRTKNSDAQPEGLQLQQLPKSRTRKASVDDEGQQQQEVAPVNSVIKPPLTPPQQTPPQVLQQSAPFLPVAPLQGYTSPTDGMLGASAPMHEEGIHASDLDLETMLCEQKEQPESFADNEFIIGSHAQHQQCFQQDDHNMFGDHDQYLYTELQNFLGNITHNNNSWNQCQLQNYQQEINITQNNSTWNQCQLQNNQQEIIEGAANRYIYSELQNFPGNITQNNNSWNQGQNYQHEIIGGALAAQYLQHTDAQHYGQSPYGQMCYNSHCLSDHFTGSVEGDSAAFGSDGDMGLTADELFANEALRDDDPQDCMGTQGSGSDPEAFQSQDELVLSSQQQHAASGQGCDVPPPSRCVSEFW